MKPNYSDILNSLNKYDGGDFTVVFCDIEDGEDIYLHVDLLKPELTGKELLDEINKQRTLCLFANYLLGMFFPKYGWIPRIVEGDWDTRWKYHLNAR